MARLRSWGRVIAAALSSRSNQEFYDKIAPVYDQLFVRHRLHGEKIARTLVGNYGGREEQILVVDIGAGTGLVSGILAAKGFRVLALDISAESLRISRQRANDVNAVQADAAFLPIGDNTCDAVVSLGAWRHFSEPRRVIAEVARVLSKSGLMVVGYFPPALGGVLHHSTGLWFRLLARLYHFLIRRRGYVDRADESLERDAVECARDYFAQVSTVSSGAHWNLIVARDLKESQPAALGRRPAR